MTDDKDSELITISDFAKLIKKSRQTVHNMIRDGVIQKDNGKINKTMGLLRIEEYYGTEQEVIDVQNANARKKYYEAKLKELEYMETKGELVRKQTVVNTATSAAIMVRDRLLAMPSSLSRPIAAIDDHIQIRTIIDTEVRAILDDFDKHLGGLNG